MKRNIFLVAGMLIFAVCADYAHAQKARLLPLGDAVTFGGAECGRINYEWQAGRILKNGKFITYTGWKKSLTKQINKTSDPKKAAKLKKQRASINKQITEHQPLCDMFNTGVLPPSSPQSPASGHVALLWTQSVGDDLKYPSGANYLFFCPPNGERESIWGTFYYSADSSVCYAAVHAGVINMQHGGNIIVNISAGRKGYVSGLRSGIKSSSYPSWPKTFAFINPATNQVVESAAPIVISWDAGMGNYRERVESSLTFVCPANGKKGSLWGTDIYTDDSSICTAAVHQGKIKFLKGGVVTAKKAPGQSSYASSTKNGVTSSSYGVWGGSFTIE